jgi:hypothetical protein
LFKNLLGKHVSASDKSFQSEMNLLTEVDMNLMDKASWFSKHPGKLVEKLSNTPLKRRLAGACAGQLDGYCYCSKSSGGSETYTCRHKKKNRLTKSANHNYFHLDKIHNFKSNCNFNLDRISYADLANYGRSYLNRIHNFKSSDNSNSDDIQFIELAKYNHAPSFYSDTVNNLESGNSFSLKRVQFAELAKSSYLGATRNFKFCNHFNLKQDQFEELATYNYKSSSLLDEAHNFKSDNNSNSDDVQFAELANYAWKVQFAELAIEEALSTSEPQLRLRTIRLASKFA